MAIVTSYSPTILHPDITKALGAHVAVIPAVGTAAIVNPAEDYNGVSLVNARGSNWVRATVTFKAGITGNTVPAAQVQLIPPGGVVNIDLSAEMNYVAGVIGAIDSISLVSVALPVAGTAASVEASTLAAMTAAADATIVANFANA